MRGEGGKKGREKKERSKEVWKEEAKGEERGRKEEGLYLYTKAQETFFNFAEWWNTGEVLNIASGPQLAWNKPCSQQLQMQLMVLIIGNWKV